MYNNHSERSNECIEFTMMCVFYFIIIFFYFCVCHHVLEQPVSDRKVNLVGTLGGQNVRKTPKKKQKNRNFYAKQFSTKSIFLYGWA
ncbi:hypothetical protein FWK35_00020238, partial [Aphis craccivora]